MSQTAACLVMPTGSLSGVQRRRDDVLGQGSSAFPQLPRYSKSGRDCCLHAGHRPRPVTGSVRQPRRTSDFDLFADAQTSPHPRGAWMCWANTGPISLSSHGVMWRFLAAPSSSDGASSDRFEQAWEGSIPFRCFLRSRRLCISGGGGSRRIDDTILSTRQSRINRRA